MKYIYILSFTIISITIFSQNIIPNYPENQHPYKNGNVDLFKDINSFLVKNNTKPCKKNEFYWATFKINENGKIFLIRNKSDILNAEKNKCAYDMLVSSVGSLKNWKSAEVNNQKVTSFLDFPFISNHYLENFKEDYDISQNSNRASYPEGINEFRKEVNMKLSAYLDIESYLPEGLFILLFTIDQKGKIENIDIEPKVKNSEMFIEDVKFAIKKIKGVWTPAQVDGYPVKSKFRFPINFKKID